MAETATQARTVLRYKVFELSAFGALRMMAEFDASSDSEALREARRVVPYGTGELRQELRIICRFGRA